MLMLLLQVALVTQNDYSLQGGPLAVVNGVISYNPRNGRK